MAKLAAPETIVATNLSLGWAAVLNRLARPGVEAISPLSLSITGFGDDGVATEVRSGPHFSDRAISYHLA
ncbi:hypothetical protein [Gluconacetobacter entanii]|uniref:hypothetical protein n=1 Tax=Gluconacetobacter entanii TaxID=108528 RepID=UPI0011B80A0A|nr:hypothetical protein [Gluconacetobacter entanii]